mgnify:CR=1 FL=1
MNKQLLTEGTDILDYKHPKIQALIRAKNWLDLDEFGRIGAVYTYVKDDIKFGYNRSDDIKASEVLADGYGQCNTKGNLLMALLRGMNIPTRFHGFTIDKFLQKGAIPSSLYWLTPQYIIHSWVEIFYQGRWLNLEGFILDQAYLSAVQKKFSSKKDSFCGYGIATTCLSDPGVEWKGEDTYIQKEGIHDDFGVFDSPDQFYRKYGTNLSGLKRWLYVNVLRHWINKNVARLRTAR